MTTLRPCRVPLVLAALLAGPAGAFAADEKPEQAGRKLFLKLQCIKCHSGAKDAKGPNLEGLFGKKEKLKGGEAVTVDEAYVTESIRKPKAKVVDGWEPVMPAFDKDDVTEEEVKALVAFVKGLRVGDITGKKEKEERPKGPTPPRRR